MGPQDQIPTSPALHSSFQAPDFLLFGSPCTMRPLWTAMGSPHPQAWSPLPPAAHPSKGPLRMRWDNTATTHGESKAVVQMKDHSRLVLEPRGSGTNRTSSTSCRHAQGAAGWGPGNRAPARTHLVCPTGDVFRWSTLQQTSNFTITSLRIPHSLCFIKIKYLLRGGAILSKAFNLTFLE